MATLVVGLLGALAGFLIGGALPAFVLGAAGALAAYAIAGRRSGASERRLDDALLRLEAIEARLARLEGTPARGAPDAAVDAGPARPAHPAADASAGPSGVPLPAAPTPAAGPARDPNLPPPRPAYGVGAARDPAEAAGGRGPRPGDAAPALATLRGWLAGGNTLTRVGVVILFIGVAFLLRYFAESAAVPLAAKLAAVGLGGVALAVAGARLVRARPGYGLSLIGAGMGIVYLTVFAAYQLYDALPPLPALAALAATAGATVWLALRHDAQALAALAQAGGFAAPMLIDTGATSPVPLFTWFAVLDAAIFAIAWRRAWRALNVLGFVFTFALGLAWGWWFYRPAHYAAVQPFLLLFFLFYVGIAILHARRAAPGAIAPVDGILVFGVPLVGFALQAGIVRDHHHGEAWSAVALAAFYAVLWLVLRRSAHEPVARLAKAFAALAVVFGTLAVPFALDARWTSAGWALEAAAVYWLGALQRQRLARAFALAVAVAAAAAFAWAWPDAHGMAFANPAFVGMALIGVGALAMAWVADRHPDAVAGPERAAAAWLLAWGGAWWLAAGAREAERLLTGPRELAAMLAWAAGSGAAALGLARALGWARLRWAFLAVLLAMAGTAAIAFDAYRSTLRGQGWLAWPLAWAVVAAGLRAVDGHARARARIADLHAAVAVAFVAWLAWEASEWSARWTASGTAWIAVAAAAPGALFLLALTHGPWRGRWPLAAHPEAYGTRAGTVVAALAATWFVVANAVSPGDAHPLPYVPLLNPLEAMLAAVGGSLWLWSHAWQRGDPRWRRGLAGVAAFLLLNGTLARAAHHWSGVAWEFDALAAHRPLQAAVTLAWTACALALMAAAARRAWREAWLAGAGLLVLAVGKLFLVDLAALSGLTRVVAFVGVGLLLLVIGYLAPLPPARAGRDEPA